MPKFTADLTSSEANLVKLIAENKIESTSSRMRAVLSNKLIQQTYAKLLDASLTKAGAVVELKEYLVEVTDVA